MDKHELVYDTVGWADYPRWTCNTCGDTCLRQPYMSLIQWLGEMEKFLVRHPSRDLSEYVSNWKKVIG